MRHLGVPIRFHTSQLDLHTIYKVSDKCGFSYNYFVTGEDDKAVFLRYNHNVSLVLQQQLKKCVYALLKKFSCELYGRKRLSQYSLFVNA